MLMVKNGVSVPGSRSSRTRPSASGRRDRLQGFSNGSFFPWRESPQLSYTSSIIVQASSNGFARTILFAIKEDLGEGRM